MAPTIEQLTEEVRDVALQVSAAQERAEERDLVASAHHSVEQLSQRYRELMESLGEMEKMKLDRQLGRRLVDIKRLASLLPRIGTIASTTPDRQVAGASEVGERRITGVSWGAGSRGPAAGSALRVGADVESWCGPCGELTTHSVVAMVGTQPKQVVCQTCNGRHGYRTTPARKTSGEGVEITIGTSSTASDREAIRRADKKAEEMRALSAEVNAAADVRRFDPKERYKPGEIIVHAEHGRGKVETVLRASLLVRFSVGGLKSLMLS